MKQKSAPAKGGTSRDIILDQAIELFAKHGFHGTSFQMIGDACDLSQAAILYHFPNRDKLLEAAVGKIVTRNHDLVSKHLGPYDDAHARLLKHFKYNLQWAIDFKAEAQVVFLIYYFACNNKVFASIYDRIRNVGRERILSYILSGVRERIFSPTEKPELIAELLHEALLAGLINAVTDSKSQKKEVLQKWNYLIGKVLNVKVP